MNVVSFICSLFILAIPSEITTSPYYLPPALHVGVISSKDYLKKTPRLELSCPCLVCLHESRHKGSDESCTQNEVKHMASKATEAWLKGSGDVRDMGLIFCVMESDKEGWREVPLAAQW